MMKILMPLLKPTNSNTSAATKKKFFVALLILGGLFIFVTRQINWVVTPSIDATLLRYTDAPFERGDYVTFTLFHELANKGQGIEVTKMLVCMAGDTLRIDNGTEFFCNDEFIGSAYTYSPDIEQDLPVFDFQGVIPEDKGFVTGIHAKSFDSRNWGFITLSESKNNKVLL
ncbi:S26 family signal peptidase [Alteromonas macleodii]|uniref:Signal peptidase, peptidase S26 family protein n=1 Tax=Alteromonas macleodii TaxID=28108 RepID=A0AB36FQU6_ALTMA|nr:S26 family signal peptidase [Alteromonas macleodii]OES24223.1 signal peptidase, peptidase S26 family protein [Alteromonas macleodii]OES24854.1 signal peptidase, peptidase S26 family protein [Alteromonas macleodii]OES25132.1 signal peptidase, peptidase S26 family protein [Alteromonas macleodii]OES39174.1 signal peptidase, peptidase S26 family protein [Alteromonas macleodii]